MLSDITAAYLDGDLPERAILAHPQAAEILRALRDLAISKIDAKQQFDYHYAKNTQATMLLAQDGTICAINPALTALLGHAPSHLNGSSITQLLPDHEDIDTQARQHLQAGHDHFSKLLALEKTDSAQLITRLTIFALDDQHLIYTFEDLTSIQAAFNMLQNSDNRFQRMIAHTNDGVWELDANHHTIYVNNAMAQMLGYQPSEMIGKLPFAFVYPDDQERVREGLEARQAGANSITKVRYRHKAGHEVWFRVSTTSYSDQQGHYVGAFAVFSDISAQKRYETLLETRYARRTNELRSLIDTLPNNIFTVSLKDWRIELCNATFAHAMGYPSPEQLEGQVLDQFYAASDLQRFRSDLQAMLDSRQPQHHQASITVNGKLLYFDTHHIPLLDDEGDIDSVLVSAHDTTERETARRLLQEEIEQRTQAEDDLRSSQENLIAILDNLPVPVCVVDADNSAMLYHNAHLPMLLEYDSLPESLNILTYCDTDLEWDVLRQRLQAETVIPQMELQLTTTLNNTRWVILAAQAITYANRSAILLSVVDITHMKAVESELQAALQREKKVNQTKSKFLSMVAHELRRPLSDITLTIDTLNRYFHKLDPERRKEKLQRIIRVSAHMNVLLGELSYIGKSQLGQVENKPQLLDLPAFCHEVALDAEQGEPDRITLNINQIDEPVWGDPSLLRRILLNLLSNALKYSDEAVAFFVHYDETGTFFTVSDNGCGIHEKDTAALFDLFYRADNVSSIEGTGIGLNIVKQSVDLMNGSVDFESKPGKGTRFAAFIPPQKPEAKSTSG